ncbi:MlaD family protein [Aliidiomarina maris]|uniref:MCE family protein n=1 Tax=Aliidiomarina maris TaxID=531312 RepID=A0A327WZJ3_9GAMM|nr:MlaD family protein [Aliidiomarina maris]RAJ98987.1 phospholipid/cholesterol/gamma-HCH transport system substrate-binding protein [Aliidiomarina maris]RUO25125.1 MCE family protein [Aliidiomarina maris]
METKAHHVMVGTFVLAAVAVLIGAILWLGHGAADRDMQFYEIVFDDEVSGLTPGSPVEYSGITVGDVQNLRLDENDPRVVRVRIRVNADTPVREDTGARLGLANITGSSLIRLYGGSPDSPRLSSDPNDPAVIRADRSGINRLLANSESLLGDVNSLVQNINNLFSDENTTRVGNTLDNVEQITAMLAEQRDDFDLLVKEMREGLRSFSQLAEQSARLIEQEGTQSLTQVRQTMAAFEQTSRELTDMLRTNAPAIERSVEGLQGVGPVTDELRLTLQTMQRLARKLEQDPQSLFLRRESIEEVNPE